MFNNCYLLFCNTVLKPRSAIYILVYTDWYKINMKMDYLFNKSENMQEKVAVGYTYIYDDFQQSRDD